MNVKIEQNVDDFWVWFTSVSDQLAKDVRNQKLLKELDIRVSQFSEAQLSWELGPGIEKENALTISPGGVVELLPVTEYFMSRAPLVTGWEFHSAKPPKDWEGIFIVEEDGIRHQFKSSEWLYNLYRFKDGTYDIVVAGNGLSSLSDVYKVFAVQIALDGYIGERKRLKLFVEVEVKDSLTSDENSRSSLFKNIADHLSTMEQ